MGRLSEVFLDTAFAIALAASSDRFHAKATQFVERLEQDHTKIFTTRAVLLEIGNALGKQRYRVAAIAMLDALEQDANVEIISITDELFARALELYRSRPDKEWGLIDCISFTVMQDNGLIWALTTDDHFRQAGFQILL